MTALNLDEIRERVEKASRWPWVLYPTVGRKDEDNDLAWTVSRPYCDKDNNGEPCEDDCGTDVLVTGFCDDDKVSSDDAAFIAHAREDVPALIAEVERLRLELTDLRYDLTERVSCLPDADNAALVKALDDRLRDAYHRGNRAGRRFADG